MPRAASAAPPGVKPLAFEGGRRVRAPHRRRRSSKRCRALCAPARAVTPTADRTAYGPPGAPTRPVCPLRARGAVCRGTLTQPGAGLVLVLGARAVKAPVLTAEGPLCMGRALPARANAGQLARVSENVRAQRRPAPAPAPVVPLKRVRAGPPRPPAFLVAALRVGRADTGTATLGRRAGVVYRPRAARPPCSLRPSRYPQGKCSPKTAPAEETNQHPGATRPPQ